MASYASFKVSLSIYLRKKKREVRDLNMDSRDLEPVYAYELGNLILVEPLSGTVVGITIVVPMKMHLFVPPLPSTTNTSKGSWWFSSIHSTTFNRGTNHASPFCMKVVDR
ncbi:hypothetical protein Gotur_008672, partial [Gossypium turneri]